MISSRTRSFQILRGGLTLVEIMIALTMTLIVLGAMMTAFQFASEQMQTGRAVMEMANRLRAAEELLRDDLSNLTVDPRPYTESTNPNGYFEIVEGPLRDAGADGTAMVFPFTANAGINNIRDTNSNGIPDPVDFTIGTAARVAVGSSDVDGDNVDDLFDTSIPGNNYRGDHDDVWMGTVRSQNQPFRGRYIAPSPTITVPSTSLPTVDFTSFTTQVIESPMAEVVWWTDFADENANFVADFREESVIVYRRVLLIRPGLNLPAFADLPAAMRYLSTNDISARVVALTNTGPYQVVANDIKDLANRQNRYCHHPLLPPAASFPYYLNRFTLRSLKSADYNPGGATVTENGNDIILTDVAAFDMKVYSPNAGVGIAGGVTVEPHDVGYTSVATTPLGAFVDLGYGGGWFSGFASPASQLTYQYRFDLGFVPQVTGLMDTVYDTWTPLYESDGIDQNGDSLIDEGTNGLDDRGPVAPDDDSERETRPPYPYPVRGVKATIRLVEENTKQIHQSAVIHSYVPE